jgi:TPR repeat protein
MVAVLVETAIAGPLEDADAAYHRSDYATARRITQPLADQGNPNAQANLGLMYHLGQRVPQSYAEALKWFRAAAELGLPRAQRLLGVMYYNGEGVPQSYVEALVSQGGRAGPSQSAVQPRCHVLARPGCAAERR